MCVMKYQYLGTIEWASIGKDIIEQQILGKENVICIT